MWLDLLSLVIILLLCWLGARKGALASASNLVALVGSYVAAIVFCGAAAPSVEPLVAGRTYLALPLAGTLVFLGTFVGLSLISKIICSIEDKRRGDEERSSGDKAIGAFFGFARASLIVFLLGILGLWLDAAKEFDVLDIPSLGESKVTSATSSTIEGGATIFLEDSNPAARVTARMMAQPKTSVTALRSLVEEPSIQALGKDRIFWSHVEYGNIDAALHTGAFQEIARDEETRQRLFNLGLINAKAAESPVEFGNFFYDALKEIAPRLQGLKNDPELKELLEDPAILHAAETGNTLALLTHPKFRRLVDRILSEGTISPDSQEL